MLRAWMPLDKGEYAHVRRSSYQGQEVDGLGTVSMHRISKAFGIWLVTTLPALHSEALG